jgi:putative endonuclease
VKIEERLKFHNAGKVKSTKKDRPWTVVYREGFTILRGARKRELQIKRWKSRKAIERLINADFIEHPRQSRDNK